MPTRKIAAAAVVAVALSGCAGAITDVKPDAAGAYVTAKNARESLCLAIEPAKVAALTILDTAGTDDKVKTDAAKAETYARAACALAEAVDAIVASKAVAK